MATTILHNMIGKEVEVYVDDMMVKSSSGDGHFKALDRFLERIKKYNLRLNHKKCIFGVTSGKLLGHLISYNGIKIDPEKVKAIQEMPALKMEKEIRGFLGRLQYISQFIFKLTSICDPIFKLLRKDQPTVWNDQCQRAFDKIKEYLTSPSVL